jgi:hypothetical protein
MTSPRPALEAIAKAIDKAMIDWKAANGGDDVSCIDMPTELIAQATLDALGPADTDALLEKRLPLGRTTRWRHKKRGTGYDVLTSVAEAQCATDAINEGDHVTVYVGDDDKWWVRKTSEFQDGRFERIAPPQRAQENNGAMS